MLPCCGLGPPLFSSIFSFTHNTQTSAWWMARNFIPDSSLWKTTICHEKQKFDREKRVSLVFLEFMPRVFVKQGFSLYLCFVVFHNLSSLASIWNEKFFYFRFSPKFFIFLFITLALRLVWCHMIDYSLLWHDACIFLLACLFFFSRYITLHI